MLARSQGMPNYNEMFRNVKNLEAAVYNVNEKAQGQMLKINNLSSEIYQARMANATPMDELIATTNLQNEVSKLSMQTTIQRSNLVKEARSNLVAQVEEAKTKYNEIMSKDCLLYTSPSPGDRG